MKDEIKNLICSKALDYLELKIKNFERKGKLFTCPVCKDEKLSANFIPKSNYKVYCFNCKLLGNVFKIVLKLEPDKKDWEKEQIAEYLRNLLKVEDVDIFDVYVKYKWALLPLCENSKVPVETSWAENIHYNKDEWLKWLTDGFFHKIKKKLFKNLNTGLRTGKVSGISVLDIDSTKLTIDVDLSKTLHQLTSKKQYHLIYKFDPDLNTLKANKKLKEELDMDIRNDGQQIVVEPSSISGKNYKWVNLGQEITTIPKEIKEKLMGYLSEPTSNLPKPTPELPESEKENVIPVIPDSSEIKKLGEGNRNQILVSIGGRLRNRFTMKDTIYLLDFINRTFCNPPLPYQEIVVMVKSLQGYQEQEELTIKKQIYDYIKQEGDTTSRDVKESLNISKAIVDKYLSEFAREGKVIRLGRGRYRHREKIEWSDDIPEQIKGLDIIVPYFNDIAYFESGDIILIGGEPKVGKTTIALNIIKRLVDQGIKPYYIYSEAGGRFRKIVKHLGIKDKEFFHTYNLNPLSIELEENAVTVLDWLLVGDKSITDTIFKHLTEEMHRKGGLLFIFMQLKEEGGWYAPNMVKQHPALAARYFYDKESNTIGYFLIEPIREAKGNYKKWVLPCVYDSDTNILNIKEEVEDDQ